MNISPINVVTAYGIVSANSFDVVNVTYDGVGASALVSYGASGSEIARHSVPVSSALCAAWTDDGPFYENIAASLGLEVVNAENLVP